MQHSLCRTACLALLLLTLLLPSAVTAEQAVPLPDTGLIPAELLLEGNTVLFNDPAVEGAIRKSLGQLSGPITLANMAAVRDFTFDPVNDPDTEGDIYDISVLQFCRNLATVNIVWQPLESIEALRGLESLYGVALTACYNITDVSPLGDKLFLSSVWLNGLSAPDVSPVLTSPNLKQFLALNGAALQTLEPLKKGHGLLSFTCDSELSDYSPLLSHVGLQEIDLIGVDSAMLGEFLVSLPMLQSVSVQRSTLAREDQLHLLRHGLQVLNLEYCEGVALDIIGGLQGLQTLRLKGNGLTDLAPLASLSETLLYLDVRENPIVDPTPVQALTALQAWGISPVEGYTAISLASLLPTADLLYGDSENYDLIELGSGQMPL